MGFAISSDFKIQKIEKYIEVKYDYTLGQKAFTKVDLDLGKVYHSVECMLSNLIDTFIFDVNWGYLRNVDGEEVDYNDFFKELITLSLGLEGDEMETAIRNYCSRIYNLMHGGQFEYAKILITENEINELVEP